MHKHRFLNHSRIVLAVATVAAAVAGFFLGTSAFGGGSPTGAEYSRPKVPGPPQTWALRPIDPGFDDFLTGFADFPLYWAGERVGGLPLDYVARQVLSPRAGVTKNKVMFFYGDCVFNEVPADGGCSRPLTIVVEPYCLIPPDMIAAEAVAAGVTQVRGGADALMVGGGRRIWTGGATVKIYAASAELIDQATDALVSPNGLGPTGTGEALPAPDTDCSEYEMVPYPAR